MRDPASYDRVLFLDIDGTIRPHGSTASDGPWAEARDGVCPDRVALLNGLAGIPGLAVVVCSAWRSDVGTMGALFRQGLAIPLHPAWRTTLDVPKAGTKVRGWQVERWLEARPGVRRFAILDDEDEYPPRVRKRLVRTNPLVGVEPSHVEALAALLAT